MEHLWLNILLMTFGYGIGNEALIPVNSRTNPSAKPKLRFNQEGKFKIVNFADLHYGEEPSSDWGPQQDINSTRVVTDILKWENPDFVIFTGDQITGEFMHPNASAYIDMLLEPVVTAGYRWASVYGNHDIGPNVTREEILFAEQKYDQCHTLRSEENLVGITNYKLMVYPPENVVNVSMNDIPALVLWFFDSRGGRNATGEIPSNVDDSVVAWFEREQRKVTEAWGLLPALAFFHIPTIEYGLVQDTISDHPECTGLVDENVSPQDQDTGFMTKLLESGTVKTAFVGHNHGNSWCCYYKTMEICYNRHTGYGGYGNWTRGARVVEATYDQPWGNYINFVRLETGSAIDDFPR